MSMTAGHKQKLIQNRMRLIDDLEVAQVIPYLIQFGVLDDRMVEEVLCRPVRQDQVSALLDLMPRRGDEAFGIFCRALRHVNQDWLADLLEN